MQNSSLANTLQNAALAEDPDELVTVRTVLRLLTGGKIVVSQAGECKHGRGWLVGRFEPRILQTAMDRLGIGAINESGAEVVLEFKKPPPEEKHAELARRLYDEGHLIGDIARRLGIRQPIARRVIKYALAQLGREMSDGRKRRRSLSDPWNVAPKYREIADNAMKL